ncbi:hypothetical protein KIN20_024217 [Parelaphostrongylus tenuis]|uniref:Uncharacterized protein n=1 Tax=Parelaphostrongylus tenuis TaxID=148309 RepID=A0AAD5MXZ8_PARTN|nr:hypothetical protein KIN20_024217 [Parelaphostrongylus tenuis]
MEGGVMTAKNMDEESLEGSLPKILEESMDMATARSSPESAPTEAQHRERDVSGEVHLGAPEMDEGRSAPPSALGEKKEVRLAKKTSASVYTSLLQIYRLQSASRRRNYRRRGGNSAAISVLSRVYDVLERKVPDNDLSKAHAVLARQCQTLHREEDIEKFIE